MTLQPRKLYPREAAIVASLISAAPAKYWFLVDHLSEARVVPMDDGGMGSLRFDQTDPMGEEIAVTTFIDADGVPVSVSLNVTSRGRLYELDVFKADFSPLIRFPPILGPA